MANVYLQGGGQMETGERVKVRIAEAFAEIELAPEVAEDIAFHMTDWKEDLLELMHLYESPAQLSNDQIQEIVIKFLAHVPNHLAAARKLAGLGPIEDIFHVGVLSEDSF
jgi:hypothetical protein